VTRPARPTAARENAVETARTYFGSENNPESNRRSARAFLIGAARAVGVIPLLFYLQFGVKATDPLTFVFVALVLAAVALPACFVPAQGHNGRAGHGAPERVVDRRMKDEVVTGRSGDGETGR